MRTVTHVKVTGLFGYMEHGISLRSEEPTLLTGPNGTGKTHLLMLAQAAVNLDFRLVAPLSFDTFEVTWSDAWSLQCTRRNSASGETDFVVTAKKEGRQRGAKATFSQSELQASAQLPAHVIPTDSGRFYDLRVDRYMSKYMVESRYGVKIDEAVDERFKAYPQILEAVLGPRAVLIDTKRLDSATISGATAEYDPPGQQGRRLSSIDRYIRQISVQVSDARRRSVRATQDADLGFAERALAAAKTTFQEASLRTRYNKIVETYADLARNGLAVGSKPMDFPDSTTPTVRRILSPFLEDWEKRLDPLVPLNRKIKTLRAILDSKLEASHKRTYMTERGFLGFRSYDGRSVRVGDLSSGEQHLVALFTLLLFSAPPGSLVLIDEPEISMHAAWKHAFLKDIASVAQLAEIQFLIATHSTAIINGRWDLTEELRFTPNPQAASLEDAVVESESDEDLE